MRRRLPLILLGLVFLAVHDQRQRQVDIGGRATTLRTLSSRLSPGDEESNQQRLFPEVVVSQRRGQYSTIRCSTGYEVLCRRDTPIFDTESRRLDNQMDDWNPACPTVFE